MIGKFSDRGGEIDEKVDIVAKQGISRVHPERSNMLNGTLRLYAVTAPKNQLSL